MSTSDTYLPAYWQSIARPVAADFGVRSMAVSFGPRPAQEQPVQMSQGKQAQRKQARVGLCLPCDLAAALVSGNGKCDCPQALSFFMRVGAIHSARMHAANAGKDPDRWTAEDWYASMEEEERLFFPLLPYEVAAQLTDEHRQFTQELKIYGHILSKTILEEHESAENAWAEYLVSHMKPAELRDSGATASGASVGVDTSVTKESADTFLIMIGAMIIIGAGALIMAINAPHH